MNRIWLVLIFMVNISIGCGQGKAGNENANRLNCILLGYDSIACYYGNSDKMEGLEKGKINDTVFISRVMQLAKEHAKSQSFVLVIKPAGVGDVGKNMREVIDILNENNIDNRAIDTLDENEMRIFDTSSPPDLINRLNGEPMKLALPKEEKGETINSKPNPNQLVILIFGADGIYAYMGADTKSGKKYTYKELGQLLVAKKSGKGFSVVIKPSQSCTYKNTINMLDEILQAKIEKYSMVEITKEEETYLHQIF